MGQKRAPSSTFRARARVAHGADEEAQPTWCSQAPICGLLAGSAGSGGPEGEAAGGELVFINEI